MRTNRLIAPLILALAATWALSLFVIKPVRPDLVGYAYAAFFLLAFIILRFSATGDVKEISLIFFLTPTFVIYFSPLLRDTFDLPYRHSSTPANVARAAHLAFVGYLSCIAGHYWARRIRPRPLLRNMKDFPINPELLVQVSAGLMILSVFFIVFERDLVPIMLFLGRITFVVKQLPMLAVASGGMAFMKGYRNPVFFALLFFVYLPMIVFIIVAQTLFYHLIILVAPLLTMYMLWRRRIPWMLAMFPILILGPAFKERVAWRNQSGWVKNLSAPELVAEGMNRIVSAWMTDDVAKLSSRDKFARERVNSLSLLAHCVREHEDNGKPFQLVSTFWFLPLSPIPRLVFPWKPVNDHGTTFGLEYGLLLPGEDFAVVLPLLVESYISGGIIGIVVLGFLMGAAYYLIFATFEHGKNGINLMALMTICYFIVYVENNITMIFGGAIQAMMLWWVLDKAFASGVANRAPGSLGRGGFVSQ